MAIYIQLLGSHACTMSESHFYETIFNFLLSDFDPGGESTEPVLPFTDDESKTVMEVKLLT